jgi:hypothetical protein
MEDARFDLAAGEAVVLPPSARRIGQGEDARRGWRPASRREPRFVTQIRPVESPRTERLGLRAGFDLALDPVRGKYGSNRTRRYDRW